MNKKTYTNFLYAGSKFGIRGRVAALKLRGVTSPTLVKTGSTRNIARVLIGESFDTYIAFAPEGSTAFDQTSAASVQSFNHIQEHILKLDRSLTVSLNDQGLDLQGALAAIQAQLEAGGSGLDKNWTHLEKETYGEREKCSRSFFCRPCCAKG